MAQPWFAFVESNTSGTGRLFAETARHLGYRPVLLADQPARYRYAAELGLDVLQLNTQHLPTMLRACRQLAAKDGLAGITSSSEYFIEAAARLGHRLGLPAPSPEVIRMCRDKQRLRSLLAKAGVGQPAFGAVTSVKQALATAAEIGFPVVIKPVKGSGGIGVLLCPDAAAVASHAAAVLMQRRNERGIPLPRRVLVEEYVDGPHISVETFGKTIVGFSNNHLGPVPHFVEIGHDHPAVLAPETERAIRAAMNRIFQVLDMWGPAHTQLRMTRDGRHVRIIEINPRLAGGFMPEMMRVAYDVDWVAETLRLVSGEKPPVLPAPLRYAAIRYILAPADGRLLQARGLRSAQGAENISDVRLYIRPGDSVQKRGDFRDRLGHVIAHGVTPAIAIAAATEALSRIRLSLERNGASPPAEEKRVPRPRRRSPHR